MHWFDIEKPDFSYIFGFLQADGHLSSVNSKGRVNVEINERDSDILESFQTLIPIKSTLRRRIRNTNFKNDSRSIIWECFDINFRSRLYELGLPVGKKSSLIAFPNVAFSEPDYLRGLIDGDGSIGITAGGWPFLSYITLSESMSVSFSLFLEKFLERKKLTSRNNRDGAYNISITREVAQKIISYLYYDGCLCLNRKRILSELIKRWERPDEYKRVTWLVKPWSLGEDIIVLNGTNQEASKILSRSIQSIRIRRCRLLKGVANIKGIN